MSDIAAGMSVGRSAVSQHLKVLKEAGLVTETPDGTRRIYRLDPRGIGAVRDWLDGHWASSLEAFAEARRWHPECRWLRPRAVGGRFDAQRTVAIVAKRTTR